MVTAPKKLLVLDLDETLVHACETRLAHPEDFRVGPYFVYRRPHLAEFIASVSGDYDVAVWTASGAAYAAQVIQQIFPPDLLRFTWSGSRCTTVRDWTTGDYTTIKKLAKVKRQGYALEHVVAVDDTPQKYARSYGNLVTVREFVGHPEDEELRLLATYLRALASVPDVRAVEKRNWRAVIGGEGAAPATAPISASTT